MHWVWPGDYHSLGLTRIQLHSPKVTPLTNPAKVRDQGLRYSNFNAWGWHNGQQSRVNSITIDLFSRMEKNSEVYRTNNKGPETLPCGAPETSTSLLRQPSTITCCYRFDRNCVRTIGKTVLNESDDLDILRATFDSKMTFSKHLRSASRASSQWLGILRKQWRIFNDRLLLERCCQDFDKPFLGVLFSSVVLSWRYTP